MQTEAKHRLRKLEEGQLWKLEQGYVYIAELGKRLIHYKLLRQPEQRAAITRMMGIDTLSTMLEQNDAQLVS